MYRQAVGRKLRPGIVLAALVTSPVSGAGLEFVVRNPKGAVTSLSATTNGEGVASVKLRLKPRAQQTSN
jgi:hypothetical protein